MYGISKLAGELLLRNTAEIRRFEYNVLRYMFVYGPRQFSGTGYKSVITKNFSRILHNRPPVIMGDGHQALDYVYIDDVVDATVRAMESPVTGQVFNVGSGKPVTIRQLTRLMLKVAGKKLRPTFQPADETKDTYRVGNIKKMKHILKCEPKIPLTLGLARTYDWMRQSKNA
jgi:nucleoside-diphosphate-sugar epimerase